MIYYISDLHLGDKAIFDKCHRPFSGLKEMETSIINKWNSIVNDEDEVYVLGDIGNDFEKSYIDVFKILKGTKYLIIGNHDHNLLNGIKKANIFRKISFIEIIEDCGRKVCLCHYPLMDWMEFNRNGIHVYGHIHNKTEENGKAYKEIKTYYSNKPAFNCGVDVTGFKPVTLDQMIKLKEENKNEPYIN